MEKKIFEGKNIEELLSNALLELNVREDEVIYQKEEVKGGLFKGTNHKITIVLLTDVSNYLKEKLDIILKQMGLDVSYESKIRSGKIQIKMYSDNNAILIGKNGKTLEALFIILKQFIFNEIGMYPYFSLDVENYKEKQEEQLEKMAKRIAKEVELTKIDATLENMNSYERRIIHNCLTNYKNVYSTSEGEEPNRHVVIKYKEEKEDE